VSSKFLSEVLITALSLALATPAPAKDLQSVAGEATVAAVVGSVAWHDSIFLGLSLLGLFGLAYNWVWWLRIGRHQPTKRSRAAIWWSPSSEYFSKDCRLKRYQVPNCCNQAYSHAYLGVRAT
jgi:hypothetical protein